MSTPENIIHDFIYVSKDKCVEEVDEYESEHVDEILIRRKEKDGEGVEYEFTLNWYDFTLSPHKEAVHMRVEVFEDALQAFTDMPELWELLSEYHEEDPGPNEVASLLANELGWKDSTNYADTVPYK